MLLRKQKKHAQACPEAFKCFFALTQLAEVQKTIFPFFALNFNLKLKRLHICVYFHSLAYSCVHSYILSNTTRAHAKLKLYMYGERGKVSRDLIKKYCVCVEGVYVKKNKILLMKRCVIPFKGFWHLVGGQVEKNETLKEALKREFKEETNLDVKVGDVVGGRIEETFDRTKIIVTFEVVGAQGEINLNDENSEYGWFAKIPRNSVYDFGKFLQR